MKKDKNLLPTNTLLNADWRKIEDELPPYRKEVLVVYYPRHPIMEGRLIGIDKRIETKGTSLFGRQLEDIENQKGFTKNVTHWMELPNLPPICV